MTVETDLEEGKLIVPDIGVTLRTLLAVAAKGYDATKRRSWKVVYKSTVIGSVRVKTNRTLVKGVADEHVIGVENARSRGKAAKSDAKNLDLGERQSSTHGSAD
jgi:hypothetical protein